MSFRFSFKFKMNKTCAVCLNNMSCNNNMTPKTFKCGGHASSGLCKKCTNEIRRRHGMNSKCPVCRAAFKPYTMDFNKVSNDITYVIQFIVSLLYRLVKQFGPDLGGELGFGNFFQKNKRNPLYPYLLIENSLMQYLDIMNMYLKTVNMIRKDFKFESNFAKKLSTELANMELYIERLLEIDAHLTHLESLNNKKHTNSVVRRIMKDAYNLSQKNIDTKFKKNLNRLQLIKRSYIV